MPFSLSEITKTFLLLKTIKILYFTFSFFINFEKINMGN